MITQENIPYTADEIKAMVKTCEKYNKALERAKKLQETCDNTTVVGWCEYIFPELKEGEGEKTRKAILTGLIDCRDAPDLGWSNFGGINIDECIAWLENKKEPKDKGEISTSVNVRKKKATGVLGEMIANINPESLQKTKEQMTTEVEQQIKGCIGMILTDANERRFEDFGVTLKECLEWLEEQGEKLDAELGQSEVAKTSDQKLEPKFHPGDWVIDNVGKIYQIEKAFKSTVKDIFGYTIVGGGYLNDNDDVRLWTIQDAKDGDVLANDHHILILKESVYDWYTNGTPYSVKAYCGIKPNGNFEIGKDNWSFCGTIHIHPATKEQRGLLFRKMEEAGYQWDVEKKCFKI